MLTALVKLTVRLKEEHHIAKARALLATFAGNGEVELQQRAVEYGAMSTPGAVPTLDGHR